MASRRNRHPRASAHAARVARPPDETRGLRLRAALLVVLGVLIYWNSLSGPFLFDDQRSIAENTRIRQLWPLSDVLRPAAETPVAGRPIVNLSFAINYAIGGLSVRGYHVANLSIHLLCTLVLFGLVRRTLGTPRLRHRFGDQAMNLAWICALIWMVHPLQTEVVDYLTERTESLMGLFYLLTVYCSLRAAETRRGGRWEAAAVASCALGMASKESMVTAPIVVMLYDRVFLFDSVSESLQARRRLYPGLAATWLVLAALMLGGPRASSVGFGNGVSPWTYAMNQALIVTHYLRLAVWPQGLVLDYGLPQSLTLAAVWPSAVFIIALVILTIAALVFEPLLGFLGAWFFITLAPTSSIVPISTEVGAERRMYLPLAALVVLGVMLGRALVDRIIAMAGPADRPSQARAKLAFTSVVVGVLCALLAAATVLRNREYESALSIARTIVERRPHGRAHYLLGTELVGLPSRHDEAMSQLREAARDYPGARYALGTELLAMGNSEAGLEQLLEFVRLMPAHINAIPAREMIGRVLMSEGKLDAAAEQFRQILKVVPAFADAHGYLGDMLLGQKRFQEAIPEYQALLKLRPRSARARENLGLALAQTGDLDGAIAEFRQALQLDGSNEQVRQNLELALRLKAEGPR